MTGLKVFKAKLEPNPGGSYEILKGSFTNGWPYLTFAPGEDVDRLKNDAAAVAQRIGGIASALVTQDPNKAMKRIDERRPVIREGPDRAARPVREQGAGGDVEPARVDEDVRIAIDERARRGGPRRIADGDPRPGPYRDRRTKGVQRVRRDRRDQRQLDAFGRECRERRAGARAHRDRKSVV